MRARALAHLRRSLAYACVCKCAHDCSLARARACACTCAPHHGYVDGGAAARDAQAEEALDENREGLAIDVDAGEGNVLARLRPLPQEVVPAELDWARDGRLDLEMSEVRGWGVTITHAGEVVDG